ACAALWPRASSGRPSRCARSGCSDGSALAGKVHGTLAQFLRFAGACHDSRRRRRWPSGTDGEVDLTGHGTAALGVLVVVTDDVESQRAAVVPHVDGGHFSFDPLADLIDATEDEGR